MCGIAGYVNVLGEAGSEAVIEKNGGRDFAIVGLMAVDFIVTNMRSLAIAG